MSFSAPFQYLLVFSVGIIAELSLLRLIIIINRWRRMGHKADTNGEQISVKSSGDHASTKDDIVDDLSQLRFLRDEGVISKDEFSFMQEKYTPAAKLRSRVKRSAVLVSHA